jgi:hypothetical protein
MGFLNSTFFQNRADGVITGGNGLELSYYLRAWLFRFDLGGFYGSFDVESSSYQQIYQPESTSCSGVNLFVNFLPMPYWGKISNIFVPSIGAGYQTASIKVRNSESKTTGSLGIGGLMFKGCLQINLGKHFFLHSEYRQGINVDSNKALYALVFGIGGRF